MVSINEKAVRPPFMILFFGTAVACGAVAVVSATDPLASRRYGSPERQRIWRGGGPPCW